MDSVRDRGTLLLALEQAPLPELLLFWGHRARKDGVISTTCLSQWFAAPFSVAGVEYATAEHFMMAEKARLFGDDAILPEILAAAEPGKAKSLGRRVKAFDPVRWEAARFDIVVAGNEAKFGQNPPLRAFLLSTGNRLLVEASPYDCVWGIGLSAADPLAADPREWRGENLLGFALMEVRHRLRRP